MAEKLIYKNIHQRGSNLNLYFEIQIALTLHLNDFKSIKMFPEILANTRITLINKGK